MTPIEKLRRIADSTALDGVADAIREVADEMDWRPIETAPKDGRRVLVWIDEDGLKREGRQVQFAKLWFHESGELGGGVEGFNGRWNITRWMPLPTPPKGAE